MTSRPRMGFLFTFPAFLLLANNLQAQSCSTHTTEGRYVFTCSGYLSPAGTLLPTRILGTATADANGTFTGSGTASIGGTIVTQTVKGTEHLNRDCTGTITYAQDINGQPAGYLDITFVVFEHGNRIDGLITDPGAVLSCSLTRISNDPSEASASPATKKELDRSASLLAANPASFKPQSAAAEVRR